MEQQAQEAADEHVETGDKPDRAHQGNQTVEQQPEKDPEPVESDNNLLDAYLLCRSLIHRVFQPILDFDRLMRSEHCFI